MTRLLFILISFNLYISSSEKLGENHYSVEPGDTLWSISRNLNVPVNELIELNTFKSYKSGFPIINIKQKIKFARDQYDNVQDYCYSHQTFDGINFSKTLSKRDIITTCIYALHSKLDPYAVGFMDSWYMSEKEAKKVGGTVGLKLSWNESQTITTDKKFWDIYFSDIRYSYYFYNLSFVESFKEMIDPVMLHAALNGDAIAADYVINYAPYFFNKYENNFNTHYELTDAVIESQNKNTKAFWKWWCTRCNGKIEEINFQELSHRYKSQYLFSAVSDSFNDGKIEYYRYRNDAIKHIQNSKSKLLSWYEAALAVNIMYTSINLGDFESSNEISKLLEDRLELSKDSTFREGEIYNRFINNIYFNDELSNMSLVLTWILNLTSTLDRLYPSKNLDEFLERREYLLKFVDQAYKNGEINEDNIANWYSDTASIMIDLSSPCIKAETFFKRAFIIYESDDVIRSDSFNEPLNLARCFIKEGNLEKTKLYLNLALQNANLAQREQIFYISFINLNKARTYFLEGKYDAAYRFLKLSSSYIFKNLNKISHTLDPDEVRKYINDYIEIYNQLDSMDFKMTDLKNNLELEILKNKIISSRRMELIKIDSNKANLANLKNKLNTNKKDINKYESLIATDFDEKYLRNIENLYSKRNEIINEMLKKNKDLDALFNPSYENYYQITKNLNSDSVIVSYNIASDGGKIILNTNSETFIFEINDGIHKIQRNIKDLRSSMNDFGSEFSYASSHKLYETLFKPIEKYIEGKKNIYLYGSALEDLPFGILINNYNDLSDINHASEKLLKAGWLIKNYSFARIYPLSNNKLNEEYDFNYLGLANPDSFNELGLSKLPNAEEEITQIGLSSQNFSKEFLLTKSDASKSNLIKKLNNSYERLVFATHSVPPNWNGISNEGALVLDDKNGDYLLTSTEIVNLDIKSDIVVLSSCSTEEKGSDSIYKSFLVAGANSVMYTNWELETISASKMTDKVFKLILFEDTPKHVALQKASIEIMNDYSNPLYAHPAFWGNFSIAYRSL